MLILLFCRDKDGKPVGALGKGLPFKVTQLLYKVFFAFVEGFKIYLLFSQVDVKGPKGAVPARVKDNNDGWIIFV